MMQLKLCLVASGYCFCGTLELSPNKLDEEQHLLLLILGILAVHLKLLQEVLVPHIICALQCAYWKLPASWFYQTWSPPPYFLRWVSQMWQQNVKVLRVSEVVCKTNYECFYSLYHKRGMLNDERALTAFKNKQTKKNTRKKV